MKIRKLGPSLGLAAVFAAAVLTLSSISAVPVYETKQRTVTETLGEVTQVGAADRGSATQAVASSSSRRQIAAGNTGLECARGRNGGATDRGVAATAIKLGATVVRSGIGSSFLGGSPVAMQAVADRVNRAGGICGRLLQMKMVDDAWDATKGVIALRALIDEGVFAIPVSPSSEGVNVLITSGDLKKKRVPLVGADGMVASQYKDPWVWPVATSTVSTMHIMVQEAWKAGARTFGLVFAKDYRFGVEGANAFNAAVRRLTGQNVPGYNRNRSTCKQNFCGILSGQPSYASEVSEFNSSCSQLNSKSGYAPNGPTGQLPSCDLVALLLEPKTALNWILKSGGVMPQGRVMGPQPLFNADFAKSCDRKCHKMVVWTSYRPPLPPYANAPAVAEYVQTVRALDPSLDTANQFTEGAYLGMKVFVEALRRVGPNLTRARLREVLDTQAFDMGLGPPLRWRAGNHLGNGSMQSYEMQYQGNAFIAFRLKSGFVRDGSLGQDL